MAWLPNTAWEALPDGNWSTLSLRIGNPPQLLNALVSTTGTTLKVPFHSAKPSQSAHRVGTERNCTTHFQPSRSMTWKAISGAGFGKGMDAIDDDSEESKNSEYYKGDWRVVVEELVSDGIERLASPAFLGVRAISSIWRGQSSFYWLYGPDFTPHFGSLLQSFPLHNTLALAYGYTAGAWYREYPGALSFGSYDNGRFNEHNSIAIAFDVDQNSLLSLTIVSIELSRVLNSSYKAINLVSTPLPTIIDSTHAFIRLPEAVCRNFQHALNLKYDPETRLFLVDKETRVRLRELNPSLTFLIKDMASNEGSETLSISLPYAAFDHEIVLSVDEDPVPYFPLKITDEGEDNLLGRAFLQEAYLFVDYGNFQFKLSQAMFPVPIPGIQKNIIMLDRWLAGQKDSTSSFLTGMTFEILIGATFTIIIVYGFLSLKIVLPKLLGIPKMWYIRRRDRQLEQLWIENH